MGGLKSAVRRVLPMIVTIAILLPILLLLRADRDPAARATYLAPRPYARSACPGLLRDAIPCHDKELEPRTKQRSEFWVLYNYVRARRRFHCWESVTFTTHGDYTFLDNLQPLIERWQGPVSMTLHAPGDDFRPTLQSVVWARQCGSPLVAELVTFHVFFSNKHLPSEVPSAESALSSYTPDCSAPPPWSNVTNAQLYKTTKDIPYPINVARNVARESAATHFVLAADIELYPNPGIICAFLDLIQRTDPGLRNPVRKVYPLSVFEVKKGTSVPEQKAELVKRLKDGSAVFFHKRVCAICHRIPKSKEWENAGTSNQLNVFHVTNRRGSQAHWEPFYIGTNSEPLYDERLTWEGKSNKMTQGYAMCVMNYEYHILDNAFLVHKPGIKVYKRDPIRDKSAAKTNAFIKKSILPEMKILFGTEKGCVV